MSIFNLKFCSVLFLFTSFLVNGQTYDFNILTTYSITGRSNGNFERNIFSNKLNNSYFLEISKYNDKLKATISDLKLQKYHVFEVIETENEKDVKEFDFKYVESNNFFKNDSYPKVYYDYKVIESDSIYKTIELTFYKNKRKKKKSSALELKLRINEFNLFPVFRFSYFHLISLNPELNIEENGIIESSLIKSENNSINCKLTHFEDVNFKLIVE